MESGYGYLTGMLRKVIYLIGCVVISATLVFTNGTFAEGDPIDVNGDGVIDSYDLYLIDSLKNAYVPVTEQVIIDAHSDKGDINGDGVVDYKDTNLVGYIDDIFSNSSYKADITTEIYGRADITGNNYNGTDLDGEVDSYDYYALYYYLQGNTGYEWVAEEVEGLARGDIDADGDIDQDDLAYLRTAKRMDDYDFGFTEMANADLNGDGIVTYNEDWKLIYTYVNNILNNSYAQGGVTVDIFNNADMDGDGVITNNDITVARELLDEAIAVTAARKGVDYKVKDNAEGYTTDVIEDYIVVGLVEAINDYTYQVTITIGQFEFVVTVYNSYYDWYAGNITITDTTGNYPETIKEQIAELFGCDEANVTINNPYDNFFNVDDQTVTWSGRVVINGMTSNLNGILNLTTLDAGISPEMIAAIAAIRNNISANLGTDIAGIKVLYFYYNNVQTEADGLKLKHTYSYNSSTGAVTSVKLTEAKNGAGDDLLGVAKTYFAEKYGVYVYYIDVVAYIFDDNGNIHFSLTSGEFAGRVAVNIETGELYLAMDPNEEKAALIMEGDALARDWNLDFDIINTYAGEDYKQITCSDVDVTGIVSTETEGVYLVKGKISFQDEWGYDCIMQVEYLVDIVNEKVISLKTRDYYSYQETEIEIVDGKEIITQGNTTVEVTYNSAGKREKQTGTTVYTNTYYGIEETTTWERRFDSNGEFPTYLRLTKERKEDGTLREKTMMYAYYRAGGDMYYFYKYKYCYDENGNYERIECDAKSYHVNGKVAYTSDYDMYYTNVWNGEAYEKMQKVTSIAYYYNDQGQRTGEYRYEMLRNASNVVIDYLYRYITYDSDGYTITYKYEIDYERYSNGKYKKYLTHRIYNDYYTKQKIDDRQYREYYESGNLKKEDLDKSVWAENGKKILYDSQYREYNDNKIVTYEVLDKDVWNNDGTLIERMDKTTRRDDTGKITYLDLTHYKYRDDGTKYWENRHDIFDQSAYISLEQAVAYELYGSFIVDMSAAGYLTDRDNDGVADIAEILLNEDLGTDGFDTTDSDGDGVWDVLEMLLYRNLDTDMAGDILFDSDGYGQPDIVEYLMNRNDQYFQDCLDWGYGYGWWVSSTVYFKERVEEKKTITYHANGYTKKTELVTRTVTNVTGLVVDNYYKTAEYDENGNATYLYEWNIKKYYNGKYKQYSYHSIYSDYNGNKYDYSTDTQYYDNGKVKSRDVYDHKWNASGTRTQYYHKHERFNEEGKRTYLDIDKDVYWNDGKTKQNYEEDFSISYDGKETYKKTDRRYNESGNLISDYYYRTIRSADGIYLEYQYRYTVYDGNYNITSESEYKILRYENGQYKQYFYQSIYTDYNGNKYDYSSDTQYYENGKVKSRDVYDHKWNADGTRMQYYHKHERFNEEGKRTYLDIDKDVYWNDGKTKQNYEEDFSISYDGKETYKRTDKYYNESGNLISDSYYRTVRSADGVYLEYHYRYITYDGNYNITNKSEYKVLRYENGKYKQVTNHYISVYNGKKTDDYTNTYYYENGKRSSETRDREVWNADGKRIEYWYKVTNWDENYQITYLNEDHNYYYEDGKTKSTYTRDISINSYTGKKTDVAVTKNYDQNGLLTSESRYEYEWNADGLMVKYASKSVTYQNNVIVYLSRYEYTKFDSGKTKTQLSHYINKMYSTKTDDYRYTEYNEAGIKTRENINKSYWNADGVKTEYHYKNATFDNTGYATYINEDRILKWNDGTVKSSYTHDVNINYYTGIKTDIEKSASFRQDGTKSYETEVVMHYDNEKNRIDYYYLSSSYDEAGVLEWKWADMQVEGAYYYVNYDVGEEGNVTYTHVYDWYTGEIEELSGEGYIDPASIIEEINSMLGGEGEIEAEVELTGDAQELLDRMAVEEAAKAQLEVGDDVTLVKEQAEPTDERNELEPTM